jgi:hypothetical protein
MTIKTITLQGKEYAQVKDRLAEFRKDNPRGLIETTPTINADGTIMFKARIVKDKGETTSAEATGHALGSSKGAKAFEKLETIAVGRALALIGYASDGEIASSEEMEEFELHKNTKKAEMFESLKEQVEELDTVEDLKNFYIANKGVGVEFDKMVNERKAILLKKNADIK